MVSGLSLMPLRPELGPGFIAAAREPGRPLWNAPRVSECTHLDQVKVTGLPESVEGCERCLAAGDGWVHLRICLGCGAVGCCDSSPNKHATAHARESGHPIIRSLEPGEEWSYCYEDDLAMVIPQVSGQTRIPPSPLLG